MTKVIRVTGLAMLLALAVTAANAQAPLDGTYTSTDIGGTMDPGREATSWTTAPDGRHMAGNVINLEGWDGAALGLQWRIYCPLMVNVVIVDNRVAGTGFVNVEIDYVGGFTWLSGAGPWGGGDPSYMGVINSFFEKRDLLYVAGLLQGSNSNYSMNAHIQGYAADCIQWTIGNGVWLGDTDGGAKTANYPAFLDANCNPTPTIGRWGDATGLTMVISGCVVPVEEQSWGAMKKLYE